MTHSVNTKQPQLAIHEAYAIFQVRARCVLMGYHRWVLDVNKVPTV